jgi:hypothetical protein
MGPHILSSSSVGGPGESTQPPTPHICQLALPPGKVEVHFHAEGVYSLEVTAPLHTPPRNCLLHTLSIPKAGDMEVEAIFKL